MREDEFRERLRRAIGEPPPLVAPVPWQARDERPSGPAHLAAAIAVGLAALLVIGLLGTRLLLHRPAPSAAAQPGPGLSCSLPVVVMERTRRTAGFITIPGGTFFADPQAAVGDLPSSTGVGAAGPTFYSPQLGRWLPTGPIAVSPDGRQYLYTVLLPARSSYSDFTSAELHVYDVPQRADRKLFTYAGSIDVIQWTAGAIIVDTVPPRGGLRLLWSIAATTGAVTQADASADPNVLRPSPGQAQLSFGYGVIGHDSAGGPIFVIGGGRPGAPFSVVLYRSGVQTVVYSGTSGDATGFDPIAALGDDHGVWFYNRDATSLWLWQPGQGLQRFAVSGLPLTAGQPVGSLSLQPAGPCSALSIPRSWPAGLPSPRPSPSAPPTPAPPPADWSTLTARPLALRHLAAGAPCPVSGRVDLQPRVQDGKWPVYGFGNGPLYLSGQLSWYAGGQAAVFLVDPSSTGPMLVRSARLDGTGDLVMTGPGASGSTVDMPVTALPPYWGTWEGRLAAAAPGCYGLQVDGAGFTEQIVLQVLVGPAPPG
jgi:hypothetical protein